jgi:hypothetical protein
MLISLARFERRQQRHSSNPAIEFYYPPVAKCVMAAGADVWFPGVWHEPRYGLRVPVIFCSLVFRVTNIYPSHAGFEKLKGHPCPFFKVLA